MPKVIIRFWWESGLSSASRHISQRFASLRPLRTFKIVFRGSSLYPKQLSLFCLLWLISACADRICYSADLYCMTELLHELKNSTCYPRSIQAFDNVSAGKEEN